MSYGSHIGKPKENHMFQLFYCLSLFFEVFPLVLYMKKFEPLCHDDFPDKVWQNLCGILVLQFDFPALTNICSVAHIACTYTLTVGRMIETARQKKKKTSKKPPWRRSRKNGNCLYTWVDECSIHRPNLGGCLVRFFGSRPESGGGRNTVLDFYCDI